jgi:hypothetical protein
MCDSPFQIHKFCRIVGASDPCRSRLLDCPLGHFFVRRESMDSGEEKPWVNPLFEDFEDLESTFCAMDGAWIS